MKVAVVGSRGLHIENIGDYLPPDTTEIISGGAKGIDTCAAEYARKHGLPLTEIKPDYQRYGRGAPIRRNAEIIELADAVVVLWDGSSRGSRWVIDRCNKTGKTMTVFEFEQK